MATLNDYIRTEAKKNIGIYNFCSDKENKRTHNQICKQLVKLADENNFPMGVLVYFAVGTNAHRLNVFERGYRTINIKKALQVIKLCEVFGKKFGENCRTNDKVVHMIARYYDVMNGKPQMFKQFCNNVDKSTFNIKNIKQSRELAKLIFGKYATYSEGGYFTNIEHL